MLEIIIVVQYTLKSGLLPMFKGPFESMLFLANSELLQSEIGEHVES